MRLKKGRCLVAPPFCDRDYLFSLRRQLVPLSDRGFRVRLSVPLGDKQASACVAVVGNNFLRSSFFHS
jgi:hypothetical protein